MDGRQGKRRRAVSAMVRVCALLIAMLLLTGGGILAFRRLAPLLPFGPNYTVIDFHTYMALDRETVGFIIESKRLQRSEMPDVPVVETNGEGEITGTYLPVSLVKQCFDPFLFWDEYAQVLLHSTDYALTRMVPGLSGEAAKNIRVIDGKPYVPIEFIASFYPYRAEYKPEHNMVIITENAVHKTTGEVTKKADIRYRSDNQSPIQKKAVRGDRLVLYGEDGEYTHVRTEDGLLGYILTNRITVTGEIPAIAKVDEAKKNPKLPSGKINMMWDVVTPYRSNSEVMAEPLPMGVNVISPTWFTYDAQANGLVSLAEKPYVDWAHGQGCQVWALFADTGSENSHALLTDESARVRIIGELVSYANLLGFDGINIDFEYVRESDADYYIQFLRELAVALRTRTNDCILSVDMYVPANWSRYYSRDRVGQTAEYICVMAYDEHYATSPVSGPVASLPFVEKGVTEMLIEVPREKLLMGLPFYNRIWRESGSGTTGAPVVSVAHHYNMVDAKALMDAHDVSLAWDETVGSYYGEYAAVEESEVVIYRLWLEDERSIETKLRIYEQYGLSGVAGWRRGFENAEVQELLRTIVR